MNDVKDLTAQISLVFRKDASAIQLMTYLEDLACAAKPFTQQALIETSTSLRSGNLNWSELPQTLQFALVAHNTSPCMLESCRVFARRKPFWMPVPHTMMKSWRCTWNELRQQIQRQQDFWHKQKEKETPQS